MKKSNKIIIASVIALMLVLTSVFTINMIKKNKGVEEPEIMISRNYAQVNPGDEHVDNTDYVTFDAFYLRDLDGDGYAEKIRGSCREIGDSDTIYMDFNVLTNGVLKDGKITINGKNIKFSAALVADSVIAQNYIGDNIREIKLNDVSSGTQKLFFGVTKANIGTNINNYTATNNSITLTGTHVADDGTETPINKVVYFTNDWYGTTLTELNSNYLEQEYDINDALDEQNSTVNVKFLVNPSEKNKQLILKNQRLELDVPELAGYKALEVKVDNSKAVVNYDSENGKVTIDLDSKVNANGDIISSISQSIVYQVTYVYPIEAYEAADTNGFTLNIPIDATYTGYNNTNPEFENPYVSNIAEGVISVLYGTPQGGNAIVDIRVGEYVAQKREYVVSKEKPINIYNNVESETSQDYYIVRWILSTGTEAKNSPVILNEPAENYIDQFLDINANYTDMTQYTKNVGIFFENQNSILGADGYINVYNDETNELIHTFTSNDWNRYSKNSPYMYDEPIAHIRVETSKVLKSADFIVYNVKELDDSKIVTDYTRPEFDELAEIYSHVHAKMLLDNGEFFDLDTASAYAKYIEPYSEAKIEIIEDNISNQQTTQNFEMNITTSSNGIIKKKWANGIFLIKYPEELIDIDVKSVESKDADVTIIGYDTYQEDGYYYTKIYTANNIEKDLNIKILADVTADPRKETMTRNVELYYYNPTGHNYYEDSRAEDIYDVNNNENVQEYIGKTSDSLNIYAPSTLLTSQTATNYDDFGSITVAPQEAIIDKSSGERTADINVNITNNYSNTISEVKIVGKIPFEENTYLLNGAELGSMFDTQMTESGIIVPEDLREFATVYYSEKENVTQDINARKNGWTTTPSDMSKVKSYLIDLGDYVMPIDNTKTFTYTVKVPTGLNYNDVSYADHAVYFCLDTDEGKLNTQTEPNKLGIKIALKYDLEITKYQKNTTIPIAGVVFSATDTQTNEIKTGTTYSNGIATIKNLYVEKEYVIKEIKTNDNYVLDTTETRIIAHVVDGHIQVEVLGGNFKTTPQVVEQEDVNAKVTTIIENEVKYNLELDKTQLGTDAAIKGIRFELTDFNDDVRRLVTNNEGKLILSQLEPNKQYRLTEIDSKGHYVKDPVTFMMVRDGNNNLQFNVIAGELDSVPQVDLSNEIPVVRTGLVNEKIPTYSLKIIKKESETENTIQGTQFKLEGDNKSSNTLYTTNENGEIIISDLYNYVEGKDVSGEYTLTEIYPGEGYILNDEPIKFKVIRNGNNYTFDLISGSIREEIQDIQIDTTDVNNPIIEITIDNEPVFTLTKLDAQTNEPIEGVTFEFTDMNGGDIVDANGKVIGYNELANVSLTSGGNCPWIQNEDGTWQSGNYNQHNTTSTLVSNNFTIEKDGILSFKWSVSSENSDYLYYTITNVNTGATIGGTNTKIYGTTYGTNYNNLQYEEISIELEEGTYNIEFVYKKDGSTNTGLDRGFVKNVRIIDSERGIKTDSNGKIRLSLTEGLYKAIETETLEGYELPEGYTGIGIGSSRSARANVRNVDKELSTYFRTESFAIKNGEIITVGAGGTEIVGINADGDLIWRNTVVDRASEIINGDNDTLIVQGYSSPNSSKRVLIKLDNNLQKVWETSESVNFDNLLLLPDGILGINSTGTMTKFNLDGQLMWVNSEVNSNHPITTLTDRNTIAIGTGYKFYEFDLNGNKLKEIEYPGERGRAATIYNNKIYISGKHTDLYVCDMDGNIIEDIGSPQSNFLIYDNNLYGISASGICKINNNDEVEWSKSVEFIYGGYSAAYTPVVMKIDGNYIYIARNTGELIKLTMDGEPVWNKKTLSNYPYGMSKKNDDEFTVAYQNGIIRTYNKNLEVVDELDTNNEINYYEYFHETNQHLINSDGRIKAFDEEGNLIFETASVASTTLYTDFALVNGNYVMLNYNGKIMSFDTNGNTLWTNSSSNYAYMHAIINNNEIIAISTKYNNNKIVKFDSDGNLIWEKAGISNVNGWVEYNDGFVLINSEKFVKYDYDGNVIWEKNISNGSSYETLKFDDGFINIHSDKAIVYDSEGNEISNEKISNGNLRYSISYDDIIIGVSVDNELIKFEKYITEPEIISSQNVVVYNNIAKYKVITKVEGTGGTISGQNEDPYETVIYKEDSVKDIIAVPEEGYKVSSITINGENVDFVENPDGTVSLDKFYEMTEDKEVIVTFVSKNRSLVINKVDSTDNSPLANARFNIIQLETRTEPDINTIAGSIVANGNTYEREEAILGTEVTDKIGNIENADGAQYYFTLDGNTYSPNNTGVNNSTANSYFKIDLSENTGTYALVVNANVSSESGYDYGYATITENNNIPTYSSTEGQFIKIAGTDSAVTTPKDYTKVLEGGREYYLHIGYRKDSGGNNGDDRFYVNSIKLYNATIETTSKTYNFVDNGNGGYESNNQGVASTTANSYIPIDLTGYSGKYNLIVNANVSSQSGNDYGYATITTNTYAPDYNNENGRFIRISGTASIYTTPTDYSTVIDGGRMYYLHLGYYKNASTDSGDDKFTINSINITLNQDDFIDTEIVTNSSGQASIELQDGRYKIVEVEAPEGYTLNTEPVIHDFVAGGENEITFRNNPQTDLIVHHYIKGTTTPVADDEYIKGDIGKEYTTSPRTDLERYQLEEDGNGGYILPDNATGTFREETQVVTYYYVLKPLELIVHHYIDGTEDSVVPDEHSEGVDGQEYRTNPATAPELDERYELVETKLPENANGTLREPITEVTYYYKVKEHIITTEVDGIGGTITGQGLTQYEVVSHGEDSVKDIIAEVQEGYQIESITINGQEIDLPDGKITTYELDKFINMTEDKHIVVKFQIERVDYKITKVWEDNDDEAGKRPQQIEIQLYNGSQLVNSELFSSNDSETPYIEFSTMSDENPWTQNDDGTWQSGNYDINSSTSKLRSNEFEISEGVKLSFDWSASSEDVRYDYLYYTITNIDNGNTIGGTSTKIGGTGYGIEYDTLSYNHMTIDLEPGRYEIEFTYTKDNSVSNGLDRGFVKNVKLETESGSIISNRWQKEFNVPLLDSAGNRINYTVIEKEVNTDDLYMYNESITYGENEATITNTFEVPQTKVNVEATKVWDDNSNENSKRPTQIKLQLKNGSDVIREQVIDVTGDSQTYTFEDLDEFDAQGNTIPYTIDEVEVNTDDLKFYSKQIDQTTYTITNTFTVPEDKTNIEVTKIWEDNSNENATRPAQIKLQVKNGTTVVQELVVDVDNTVNEKVYTFENLALYDTTGQVIEYTVDEVEVNENDLTGYTKSIDGNTITNTIVKHKITTDVNGQGGTISGQGQDPYEEVNHKGDSVKDLVITPEAGYKIKSITINDVEQELPNDVYNEYSMPKFEEMTEDKHIVVEFELVEHIITTEVDGVGGTISGQNENPYETVIHTYDSTKEIKATPDSGYKITSITVNGNPIEFTPANDGTYTLPLFENMIEDKHIVVKFERKDTSIIIKHQTEDGTDLVTPETRPGKVGDEYRTDPIDFEEYDLKTTPDNANGNMAEEQIEVIYIYSKVKGTITVNKVDKTDSSIKLEGATFRLEKLDDTNNVDSTFEAIDKDTNEQGQAIFENLDVGKYKLTEVKAPEGYELTNEVVDVEVTKAERDVNVTASDRMKIVLPATGKINYSLIISGIGLIAITTAFVLKKKEKKASQE